MKYIVPKIFCAVGTLTILAGIFLSELDITLGDMLQSTVIAIVITAVLLLFALLAFKLKQTDNMIKIHTFKAFEVFSVTLFIVFGLASLLIFNHCITVWERTGEIRENMNVHQLDNMLPEYEKYAKQRIKNYETQLDEAILYKEARSTKLTKLKQVVYPHIYDSLKISINDSISKFVSIVEDFSPLTMPKNITRIEEWVKSWEEQLVAFSHYKMNGENADDFVFESRFDNVTEILTEWQNFTDPRRFLGYCIGVAALICMLFPYFKAKRTNKLNY